MVVEGVLKGLMLLEEFGGLFCEQWAGVTSSGLWLRKMTLTVKGKHDGKGRGPRRETTRFIWQLLPATPGHSVTANNLL